MIDLFEDKNSPVEVKSIVLSKLHELNTFLKTKKINKWLF